MFQKLIWVLCIFLFNCELHGAAVLENEELNHYVSHKFSPPNAVMNHLVVDENLGYVYIGAQNSLYQLNKDLDAVIENITTGPKIDHYNCLPMQPTTGPRACTFPRELTNNTNKLLLIDRRGGRLLECGSIYKGTCKTRDLVNISQISYEVLPSEDIQQVDMIACNTPDGSTVGIISEGPTINNPVLYAATTVTNAHVRNEKTMSTYSLYFDPTKENKLLKYAIELENNEAFGSFLPDPDSKKDYKYIFETGAEDGFIYYVFNEKSSKKTKKTTKTTLSYIARICKSDPFYYSYVEILISCSKGEAENEVLGAHYAPDKADNDSTGVLYLLFKTENGSSVCYFTKQYLDAVFYNTMEVCYVNRGKNGTKQIVKGVSVEFNCIQDSNEPYLTDNDLTKKAVLTKPVDLQYYPDYAVPATQLLCGAFYLPFHLSRIEVTYATFLYGRDETVFSAITTDKVKDTVVGFIGTESGSIIQVDFNTSTMYNEIPVGEPILSDFVWDQNTELSVPHLYVTTESAILHMRVAACEKFTSCDSCIRSNDPYCGWCILESRCSTKKQCHTADLDRTRWLGPDSNECIYAKPPKPVARTLTDNVILEVSLLPVLNRDKSYQCVFDGNFTSEAEMVGINSQVIEVSCPRPSVQDLPESFPGEDYANVSLSVRYVGVDVITTTVMFYDCNVYGSTLEKHCPCAGCLSSRWQCRWCVTQNRCVPQEKVSADSDCLADPTKCPTIVSVSPQDKVISVGQMHSISLSAVNLRAGGTYRCSVDFDWGTRITVNALRPDSGDRVICNEHVYNYSKNVPEAQAYVTVYWKLEFVVDFQREENKTITFYKCSAGRSDCSRCVTADPKYNCGWCKTSEQCTIEQFCPSSDWVTNGQSCPVHEITGFSPSSGPIDGGTIIHIFGVDMGTRVEDIQRVTVGDTRCIVDPTRYQISVEVVCQIEAVPSNQALSANIAVIVKNQTVLSAGAFKFRNPTLHHVEPELGPQAGGTSITITGENLNTGSLIQVYIGDTTPLPCHLQPPVSSNTLNCITDHSPHQPTGLKQDIRVTFDNLVLTLSQAFSYVANPQIKDYYTLTPDKLSSFLMGGRNISVKGTGFDAVQTPLLIAMLSKDGMRQRRSVSSIWKPLRLTFLQHRRTRRTKRSRFTRTAVNDIALPAYVYEHQFVSQCDIKNNTFMTCYSPAINISNHADHRYATNISSTVNWSADVLIKMDNLDIPLTDKKLLYYPNPRFQAWTKTYTLRSNEILKIKVFNLKEVAITKSEVYIMIGMKRCMVAAINDNDEVWCTVPQSDGEKGRSYPVTAQVGHKNDPVFIGTMVYYTEPPPITVTGVIAIACGCVVLFLVIFGYLMRKRKVYEANKNDFQKAIENMEMSVRADFRKAFAELNVDMSDLTADVGDYGIPCLDYRTYVTNLFFPSCKYHPCTKAPDPNAQLSPNLEQGLSQFLLLLSNRNFLSLFIHTLEEQKNFSNRDKGNVASLLTVVLHNQLDYFTEIMKSLVSDLISVNVQRNPKLILRRSDSVAERMLSNWMYICLYPYLRDKAGGPIFLLLKAIKQQVSKGPVDGITGKAMYTLSDDRLLQEDIENEVLTVFVAPNSPSHDDEPVIVKVLTCDSIAQVKEKVMDALYKRVHFSKRPRADQLDVEWRHGRSGHLVLPNHDYAMEQGSRWRRLMTIYDYKVPNNATLALIPTQQEFEGSQDMSSMVSNHDTETSQLSPMLPEEGSKIYHLVKYADEIEAKRESTIQRDRHKHIADLYLLRLINMKGILQSYVDEVLQAILDKSSVPCPVKHFFHFLDDIANEHGINDPEILHIWKTNSLLGRFWVTILKSPESVFDIEKPDTIASSMSVISQTFIDACSVNEHKPTKDSPINKQLYAREIPNYKKLVQDYYEVIKDQPTISDQDINAFISDISREHGCVFDVNVALKELWGYMSKYFEEVMESLENDDSISNTIAQRLQQTYSLFDSVVNDGV